MSNTFDAKTAGQAGWTRDLARDLFPGRTTPFAWTLLAAPADQALRNAYSELGGAPADARFLHLEGDYAYLNAEAIAEADQSLCGAGWLGRVQPQPPGGLRGRLHSGGVAKRCQARLSAALIEAGGLQTRLSRWLAWVQGVKWTQADLLQVMEELEPHGVAALQTYFLLRVAVNAASAAVDARLREWLPSCPPDVAAGLALGVVDLPSIAIADVILDAAHRSPTDPQRLAAVARCSHRGPGEIRPDALRWPDAAELMDHLAAQANPVWTLAEAIKRRQQALAVVQRSLNGGQYRQLLDLLADLGAAMRAADIAWDSLTMVMAAAQRWVGAAGREALVSGLIARPADVLYLELEELKQVATGEWHAGDREDVQASVARRMRRPVMPPPAERAAQPVMVCPGACDGPQYRESPREAPPPRGAAWLGETADAGCAPLWQFAGCLLTSADDAWTPGLVVARGLGIPARAGA